MKQLLLPVRCGQVKYVYYTEVAFRAWLQERFGKDTYDAPYFDPTDSRYAYPEFMQWLINEELRAGKLLVGSDGDSWLFADRDSIEENEKGNEKNEPMAK